MPVRTSTVEIPTADGTADAFLATPGDDVRHPAVLFYMDAFGPRPRLEEMARRIAAEGYAVLVPNVFYRRGPAPLIDTSDLMDPEARGAKFEVLMPMIQELTPGQAMSDADAYLDYLRGLDRVADGPVGTTGYCMGG